MTIKCLLERLYPLLVKLVYKLPQHYQHFLFILIQILSTIFPCSDSWMLVQSFFLYVQCTSLPILLSLFLLNNCSLLVPFISIILPCFSDAITSYFFAELKPLVLPVCFSCSDNWYRNMCNFEYHLSHSIPRNWVPILASCFSLWGLCSLLYV